jgi:hypothetical protein
MSAKTNVLTAAVATAILSLPVSLFAQQVPATNETIGPASAPATGPAAAPASAVALKAVISSVKGVVQVRVAEDQPWQPARQGMVLGQGAEFRTGLRSAVQFVIEPDQVITLDRLGTMKVLQAFQDHNKVTTDLGVKYGRARYDIQNADLEHQSTIRSPGSTLAIRGTDVTYEDQVPWVPSAVSRHGRAEFRSFNKNFMPFGGTRHTVVAADKNGPAQQAITTTRIDPRTAFAGRSANEENLLLTLQSGGGIDSQGQQALQSLAKYNGFAPAFIGVPTVPGPLEIDLFWQSTLTAPNATSVDLQVTDPKGKTASIANPVIGTGSAMATYTGDNKGLTGSGEESVVWPLFFPAGKYKVKAISRSGDPAQIFITAYQGQNANAIVTYGVNPQPAIVLQPGQTFSGTVATKASSKVH